MAKKYILYSKTKKEASYSEYYLGGDIQGHLWCPRKNCQPMSADNILAKLSHVNTILGSKGRIKHQLVVEEVK